MLAIKAIIVNSNAQMSIDSEEALRMAAEIVNKNELADLRHIVAEMIIERCQLEEELAGAHPAHERLRRLIGQLEGEKESLVDEMEVLKGSKEILAATVKRLKGAA